MFENRRPDRIRTCSEKSDTTRNEFMTPTAARHSHQAEHFFVNSHTEKNLFPVRFFHRLFIFFQSLRHGELPQSAPTESGKKQAIRLASVVLLNNFSRNL